jgi:YD repeat-containing protein
VGLRKLVTRRRCTHNLTTYGYDKLDRLTSAVTKDLLGLVTDDYGYVYDAAGNRTSDTVNGAATPAVFNDADQLTSRGAVAVTYSYDANGNQTDDPQPDRASCTTPSTRRPA